MIIKPRAHQKEAQNNAKINGKNTKGTKRKPVARTHGGEVRLGAVAGTCVWVLWLGPVAGSSTYSGEVRLGAVAGTCVWVLWL